MLIALAAALLTMAGVVFGVQGTYLMTAAYHPFEGTGVFRNWLRCVFMFVTFRWRSVLDLVGDVASFGELNREDRAKSLLGIYVLFSALRFKHSVPHLQSLMH